MGMVREAADFVAIEPVPAVTFMVNGFHRISYLGHGMMLFTFYRKDVATEGHGQVEHVVEVKLQAHWSDVMTMIREASAAVAGEAVAMVKGPTMVM